MSALWSFISGDSGAIREVPNRGDHSAGVLASPVAHVGDRLHRAQPETPEPGGSQTPPHGQRLLLIDSGHLVDSTVAHRASHTMIDVNRMIEVDVVRHIVNSAPRDGFARKVAVAHRLELRLWFQIWL